MSCQGTICHDFVGSNKLIECERGVVTLQRYIKNCRTDVCRKHLVSSLHLCRALQSNYMLKDLLAPSSSFCKWHLCGLQAAASANGIFEKTLCCKAAVASLGDAAKSLHRRTASAEIVGSCNQTQSLSTEVHDSPPELSGPVSSISIPPPKPCCAASCGCHCLHLQSPHAMGSHLQTKDFCPSVDGLFVAVSERPMGC